MVLTTSNAHNKTVYVISAQLFRTCYYVDIISSNAQLSILRITPTEHYIGHSGLQDRKKKEPLAKDNELLHSASTVFCFNLRYILILGNLPPRLTAANSKQKKGKMKTFKQYEKAQNKISKQKKARQLFGLKKLVVRVRRWAVTMTHTGPLKLMRLMWLVKLESIRRKNNGWGNSVKDIQEFR